VKAEPGVPAEPLDTTEPVAAARPATPPGRRPFGVFVSYRRDDSSGHAGRLFDKLAGRFGERRVFMDVSTIRPGMDFRTAIDTALASSSVVLAIIGKRWVDAANADGTRRLDEADDLVRLEIASALRLGLDVIPVLVQRAAMPSAEQLPEELRALRGRHAIEIDDARWDQDVTRLIHAIEQGGSPRAMPAGRRAIGLVAVLGVVVAVAAGAWLLASGPGRNEPTASVPASPVAAGSPSAPVSSAIPTASAVATATAPATIPSFGSLLLQDPLVGPVAGLSARSSDYCEVKVADGLAITALEPNYFCDANLAAIDPAIVSLQDVRVDVAVDFSRFSDTTFEYGPGDAYVQCRREGTTVSGSFYVASFSAIGYWQIARFVNGKQATVDDGFVPELVTTVGQSRRLRLACTGPTGGPTVIAFSVDGRSLSTYLDPDGLDRGSVALGVSAYQAPDVEASFHDLEIRGP
jgi:hypothetical protein